MYIPIQFLSSLRAIVAKNVSFKVLIHMAQKSLACVPLGKPLTNCNLVFHLAVKTKCEALGELFGPME